jgi:hypothetical protein
MWVFTKEGFFSAVENRNNREELIVRGRSTSDIQRLSNALGVPWKESDRFADYPVRLTCSKTLFAEYLSTSAYDIDYDNFKNAMENVFDASRMSQLHEVWRVMR